MTEEIYPYQYYAIQKQVGNLISTYKSVNDAKTVLAVQALTTSEIDEILGDKKDDFADFKEAILDRTLTNEKAEALFKNLKDRVIPFKAPSIKQIEKIFKKVKKLKVPNFDLLDLRDYTYLSWYDAGNQKKFVLYYEDDKLKGIYGSQSSESIKNICTICHKTSSVAMFLATTKKGAEGTYTKRGNYICTDSDICNHNLVDIENFNNFVNELELKK